MEGNKAARSSNSGSQGVEPDALTFVLVEDEEDCLNFLFRQAHIQ